MNLLKQLKQINEQNKIVLPISSSNVFTAGIGGKEIK